MADSNQVPDPSHGQSAVLAGARPRAHVLQQVMALRYRALLASRGAAAAAERHHKFLAASAVYREVFGRGDSRVGGSSGRTTIGGLEWWIPPDARLKGGFADRMLRRGWLPFTDILLARQLAVGAVMIDIGANIGTTAIPRVVLGDFQYVYAVEPEPANYGSLVHNIVANGLAGLVLPDRVAISDVDGEGTLRVAAKMAQHTLKREPRPFDDRSMRVDCLTLDTWVRERGIDLHEVTFIKCDTQGWEGYILRGAREVLRHKHIAWQLEFWPKGLRKAEFDRAEFYELIRRHFTHFLDLSRGLRDLPEVQRTDDLETRLADVGTDARGTTDLLVYNDAD